MTTKRNIRYKVQDTILPSENAQRQFWYDADKAVMNINAAISGKHPKWSEKIGSMLRQMEISINAHLRHYPHTGTPDDMDESLRWDRIRKLFVRNLERTHNAKRVFSVRDDEQKHGIKKFHNGYFLFRPANAELRNDILEMLACLKILTHNSELPQVPKAMVIFGQWIQQEMESRLRY